MCPSLEGSCGVRPESSSSYEDPRVDSVSLTDASPQSLPHRTAPHRAVEPCALKPSRPLVCSRVMNQPLDANKRGKLYSGMIDCFVKTSKSEGVPALWKGSVLPVYTCRWGCVS